MPLSIRTDRLVKGPKALCELQGYVFDAKRRVADAAEFLGDPGLAAKLRQEAADLQERFEERFWCEDLGFYAYALDGDKKQVKTIASNAGHLLWSGIVRPDRAEQVVRRLREPDMWSGWGIRTLSARHPAYNPFSYQNGSVWPHDNGLIAMGFKRYGFAEEAALIARDISEAGQLFLSSIACRNSMPALNEGRERFRCNISGRMCRKPGRRAVCFIFSARSLGSMRMRPETALRRSPASALVAGPYGPSTSGGQGDGRPSFLARRYGDQA